MNSNLSVFQIHEILWNEMCVDGYTIKVDNYSQDVTLNVAFTDCKKRFVFEGGRGVAFSNRCNKNLDQLADLVVEKNKALKENG